MLRLLGRIAAVAAGGVVVAVLVAGYAAILEYKRTRKTGDLFPGIQHKYPLNTVFSP